MDLSTEHAAAALNRTCLQALQLTDALINGNSTVDTIRRVSEQLADTAEILQSYAGDLETGVVNEHPIQLPAPDDTDEPRSDLNGDGTRPPVPEVAEARPATPRRSGTADRHGSRRAPRRRR
ncbi:MULTISPECIES: hypothetical protein [unclassified Amycolatopsis]|uniref:hypothetical protein n=1 Tax=unclassified Amycolatopsis TaxID=2618356 RepID=UPI001C69C0CD|nr:hypothetical protein [Amycolatopsis sp. DSM 110486]QYN20192.1 hypothetical protein K1T34_47930 [Amycolatopsis sp. DSM 110486]